MISMYKSDSEVWAKVKSAFKGGDRFKLPMQQKMTFVDGYSAGQDAHIQMASKAPSMSITDTWHSRKQSK